MKKYLKLSFLFALCFTLYGCPEGDEIETNTVDMAKNEPKTEPAKTVKQ